MGIRGPSSGLHLHYSSSNSPYKRVGIFATMMCCQLQKFKGDNMSDLRGRVRNPNDVSTFMSWAPNFQLTINISPSGVDTSQTEIFSSEPSDADKRGLKRRYGLGAVAKSSSLFTARMLCDLNTLINRDKLDAIGMTFSEDSVGNPSFERTRAFMAALLAQRKIDDWYLNFDLSRSSFRRGTLEYDIVVREGLPFKNHNRFLSAMESALSTIRPTLANPETGTMASNVSKILYDIFSNIT